MMNSPYYLTKNSYLPLMTSMVMLSLAGLTLSSLWSVNIKGVFLIFAVLFSSIFIFWVTELKRESICLGLMVDYENKNILFSFLLFIMSEIMFFLSFFWSFFHFSLTPDIELGNSWPPMGVEPIPFFETPLLNTIVLLTSGITITWAHHLFFISKHILNVFSLTWVTILLGVYFSFLQLDEYLTSSFSINDSSYGSNFFVATGFHGLHIIVGSLLLLTIAMKMTFGASPTGFQTHFEVASWYWHFVDVVWLFLYLCLYWWGN